MRVTANWGLDLGMSVDLPWWDEEGKVYVPDDSGDTTLEKRSGTLFLQDLGKTVKDAFVDRLTRSGL